MLRERPLTNNKMAGTSRPALLVAIFAAALVGSCCEGGHLSIQNEYLTYDYLASVQIDSPDPRRCAPFCGQQLIVGWRIPKCWMCLSDLHIVLCLRFRNLEMREIEIPIRRRFNDYVFRIINNEYFRTNGILTYRAELRSGDEVLDTWTHQVWTRLIDLSEYEEDDEDEEEEEDDESLAGTG